MRAPGHIFGQIHVILSDVSLFAIAAASVVFPCDLIPSNHQKCRVLLIRLSFMHVMAHVINRHSKGVKTIRPGVQLELSASNTIKVDYRLPVTCSDFNSTTVNSLGLDFIDLLPVTLSISYRCLNVVSNTDFFAICIHYCHFSNRIVTNIILL